MCSRCVAMYVLLPCVHICLKKEEDEKLEERRGEEVGRRRGAGRSMRRRRRQRERELTSTSHPTLPHHQEQSL